MRHAEPASGWTRLGTAELVARERAAIDRLSQALQMSLEPFDRAEIALLLGEALINAGRAGDAELTFDAAVEQLGDRNHQLLPRLETARLSLGVLDQRFMAGLKSACRQLRPDAERGGRAGRMLLVLLLSALRWTALQARTLSTSSIWGWTTVA